MSPDRASTAVARDRLNELLDEARRQTGRRALAYETLSARDWQPPASARDRLVTAAAVSIPLALLVLFAIGVADGFATVISWLR